MPATELNTSEIKGTVGRAVRQLSTPVTSLRGTTFWSLEDSASLTDDPGVAHGGFYFRCHGGRRANQREADVGQHALENV